jgi:hypothetical protein
MSKDDIQGHSALYYFIFRRVNDHTLIESEALGSGESGAGDLAWASLARLFLIGSVDDE